MGIKSSVPHTVLTPETIYQLSYFAGCSPDVVVMWHRRFLSYAPDGKLKKAGFEKLYQYAYPGFNTKPLANLIFKYYDADNSRWISFVEFFLPNILHNNLSARERATCIFHIIDSDNNGRISLKEMTAVLKALYQLRGMSVRNKGPYALKQKAEQIFSQMDFNKDKFIDKTEFVYAMCNDHTLYQIFAFDFRIPQ
ncbi:hypothetical protein GJ496_007357 [Pomphorhynchus laevis]|nr:hypothetical protein GJ496_007357 [Pomphorhynchus laevis]